MAGRKKSGSNALYNFLLHEVTVINNALPKDRQLSYKERLELVSTRYLPKYQATPLYQVKRSLTPLREYLTNSLKRSKPAKPKKAAKKAAGKKAATPARKEKAATIPVTYNFLLHEVTVINATFPADRQLSYRDRRDLVKDRYYPKYKGTELNKRSLAALRKYLNNSLLRAIPGKALCDILAIPVSSYEEIPYYELDPYINSILEPCVQFKVFGLPWGETPIQTKSQYGYESSGLKDLTDALNEEMSKGGKEKKSSTAPHYTGHPQMLPGHENEEPTNENLYLEFVLVVGRPTKRIVEIKVSGKKATRQEKKNRKKAKKKIQKKVAAVRFEKTKSKNFIRSVTKAIKEAIASVSTKAMKKQIKKYPELLTEVLKDTYNEQAKRIKKAQKSKVINESRAKSLLQQLDAKLGK